MKTIIKKIITKTSNNTYSLTDIVKTVNNIAFFALITFILSPVIHLFTRIILKTDRSSQKLVDLYYYKSCISVINYIVLYSFIIIILIFVYFFEKHKESFNINNYLTKNNAKLLAPYIIFIMFAIWIIFVTIVRGPSNDDLTGYWSLGQSIFSFISYAITYFFCGMILVNESKKTCIQYIFIISSLFLNIITLINVWVVDIPCLDAQGYSNSEATSVFLNSNYYGYYLVITTIIAALTYVYEQKTVLKILSIASAIIGLIVLIINDTLGAYLAVFFVTALYFVYCLLFDKKHFKNAVLLLFGFLIISFVMSIFYDTIISSLSRLILDIDRIKKDPNSADSAGSGRWKLWKNTVYHIPEHPILGFGIEGLKSKYNVGTPHNEFLQYAAFFGIPEMLLYMTACTFVLFRIFKNRNDMNPCTIIFFFASIGYLTSSFFGVTVFHTTAFFYILLGLTYSEYLKKKLKNI